MSNTQIHILHTSSLPVDQLFQHLAEHEHLSALFAPVKVERLKDGETCRNGQGSARTMRVPLAPSFVETVTDYEENKRIEYRITDGFSPLKNHRGIMTFSSTDSGSMLDYRIEFEGKLPGIATLVRVLLTRSIKKGLSRIS